MAQVTYTDNLEEYLRELRRAGVALQQAAADAINDGAKFISVRYKNNLKREYRLRAERFTLGAVRLYQAHPRRSSGKLRAMNDVNAKIVVPNMKGGGTHYLAKQEEGYTVRGARETGGKVPVPLRAARTSQSENKPVAKRYRLKNANIRQARDLSGMNARQRYGALRRMVRNGKMQPGTLVQTENTILQVGVRKHKVIRSTKKTQYRLRKRPVFQRSTEALSEAMMVAYFKKAARKRVREANLPA